MANKSRQVEPRMLSEYLLQNYSNFSYIMDVPLGNVDPGLMAKAGYEKALGISRPFRPKADAVVILPNYFVLVESKVWNVVNGLAKLPLYKSLVPFTPELAQYMPREVLMELVVGWTNSNLEVMARDMGVTVRIYNPPWLADIVDSMHQYWTKQYQQQRQDKIKLREYFGVE